MNNNKVLTFFLIDATKKKKDGTEIHFAHGRNGFCDTTLTAFRVEEYGYVTLAGAKSGLRAIKRDPNTSSDLKISTFKVEFEDPHQYKIASEKYKNRGGKIKD